MGIAHKPQSLLLKMHAPFTLGQLTLLILLKYLAADLTLHFQKYTRSRSVIYFDLSGFLLLLKLYFVNFLIFITQSLVFIHRYAILSMFLNTTIL